MTGAADRVRLLALGDSYTIGEGVAADARWPLQLQRALRAAGTAALDVRIIATTGWTCADLEAALDAATLAPPYDLVVLGIGVNDQYRGTPVADYEQAFPRLLQRAIALTGDCPSRVLLLSIPDWSATRFAREHGRDTPAERAAIDAYNAAARAATTGAGAHWVDVTPVSVAHANALAADGLHPSAAQYARWLPAIERATRAALGDVPGTRKRGPGTRR